MFFFFFPVVPKRFVLILLTVFNEGITQVMFSVYKIPAAVLSLTLHFTIVCLRCVFAGFYRCRGRRTQFLCVCVCTHVSLFVRKKKAILVSLLCKTKFHSNTVSVVVIKLAAVFGQ